MKFWRLFTRRMVAKVFLTVGVTVGAALMLQAWLESKHEEKVLKAETQTSARQIAHLVMGTVEHSMLEGDGIKVKALLGRIKDHVPAATVKIYDRRGIEVFGAKPPAPTPRQIPPWVLATMTDGKRKMTPQGRIVRPIPAEERCKNCHKGGEALRGILELDIDTAACAKDRETVMPRLVRSGFIHIMTARRSKLLGKYFEELSTASGVGGAAVYDEDGEVSFGKELPSVEAAALKPLLVRGAKPKLIPLEEGSLSLVPLPMEERCVACHDDKIGDIRGVLAVQLRARPTTPGTCATAEIEGTIDTSLRFIMLSELGRRIADFLDSVAATSAVRQLILYDAAGRSYWNTRHRKPPPDIARALSSLTSTFRFSGMGKSERVYVVEPLLNKKSCMQCHGSDSKVRGAVVVSLSTAAAARERAASLKRRTQFTVGTLVGILFILIVVLQYLVARRVGRIGDVADSIGEGNLAVEVVDARPDGDEIARLGDRINQMVRGLRAKMHLEKFVSRGTALAASSADLGGISRTGESRDVTILFSDIRGFTAYSEQRSPSEVVEMLNRLLQAQAEVVPKYGGDIDKFVGDELLAVFEGTDAAVRAVRCAEEIIQAVHRVRVSELTVGVGISTGEVVYGAVGHEDRMDFTVIGDVVNTGARLCGAAAPDQILVTEAVRDAVSESDIVLEDVEPISVKGKREPLLVFRVSS